MISFVGRLLRGEIISDPVLTPSGFEVAKLPLVDDDEPATEQTVEPDVDVFGQAFVLIYVDSKGEISERRVIGRACYNLNENIMFRAKCLERQSVRTFRVDRISQLFCGVTGEQLSPITDYLSPNETLDGDNSKNQNSLRAATRVLMTLARSDGHVHPKELEVIDNFLNSARDRLDLSVNIDNLRSYARRLAPDFENFIETAEAALRGQRMFAFQLIEAARVLVKADGAVTREEHVLIDDLMQLARIKGKIGSGEKFTSL